MRYSFAFWEDADYYSGEIQTTVTGEAETAGEALPSGGSSSVYRVAQGDTLWGIARQFGLSLETLVALNPQIKNPNLIRPGDEVRVA